jgi:hypothetical protein
VNIVKVVQGRSYKGFSTQKFPERSTLFPLQALSQALLQVRADLVDTAQRTLEGEAARETHEANVKELVEKRTQQLMVCL